MERFLLKNINIANSQDIKVYIANGGYKAIEIALGMGPENIIKEVKKSGLLGRSGAAFPVGTKWSITRREIANPKYVICNADEGEPGTFKDRIILKKDPHLLIEGMIIAAYAIGANQGYIYIRGEYYSEIESIMATIVQARNEGYLGNNILDSGFPFEIGVYKGAGAYICGEETSLIESMSGMRATPDSRPPFPSQHGLSGKPTVVNNVETLINIPFIIANGGEWYSLIGSPDSPGNKLFCLSGHINQPGLYELPLGITLRELIEHFGHGMKGEFKAALTGGVSSSLIEDLDIKLDYKSVSQAGGTLSSASVIVINKDTNIIDVARNVVEFFARESCGKCSICREGTRQSVEIMKRFTNGEARRGDINLILELNKVLMDTSGCGLGQAALNMPVSAIKLFRSDFEEKVRS